MITDKEFKGVDDTVKHMFEMTMRHCKEPLLEIVFGGKNFDEIFKVISEDVKYIRDPMNLAALNGGSIELLRSPKYTLTEYAGDCDCKAILMGSLLQGKGVPFRVVVTSSSPKKNLHHVYLDVLLPTSDGKEEWLPWDATYPTNEIWKEKEFTKKIAYYNLPDGIFKEVIKE